MLNCPLADVVAWTDGRLSGTSVPVRGLSTDSRHVRGGELFVALEGEIHDGHDHVASAVAAGAVAALVSRELDVDVAQVCVDDTLKALGDIARVERQRAHVSVIGITGSNGKTTVKALTAAILSRHAPTHATAGNYNNEIGLPLTLLAMPEKTRYAVIEMGAGKPGDIDYLASIACPDIGLVNTIAPAHLERMGSLQGVAETKGAMYTALPVDGTAIINADGEFADYFDGLAGTRRKLRFGWDSHNDVYATIHALSASNSRFRLHLPTGAVEVDLPLAGRHNVANAMAAATIACALGIPDAVISDGLANAPSIGGRLDAQRMPGDWWLIDDSYNANPGSVAAAIDTLLLHSGEHWLVLGDMAELGPDARRLHAELGVLARERGVEHLFAVGPLAGAAVESFGAQGQHFATREDLVRALRDRLHAGVVCLVKGSRSAAMDQVVTALARKGKAHVA